MVRFPRVLEPAVPRERDILERVRSCIHERSLALPALRRRIEITSDVLAHLSALLACFGQSDVAVNAETQLCSLGNSTGFR
jgi:hypothetical protein